MCNLEDDRVAVIKTVRYTGEKDITVLTCQIDLMSFTWKELQHSLVCRRRRKASFHLEGKAVLNPDNTATWSLSATQYNVTPL